MPTSLLPVLVAIHVLFAISLFLPSLLLPFALRVRRPFDPATAGGFTRALLTLQGRGTVVIGLGLALSGAALLAVLGWGLLSQPWLLAGLTIYAIDLGLAFFVQRPNLRRLIGLPVKGRDAAWATRARRQRYISYLMAGLTGTIGVLMSTKPVLW